MNAGPTSYDDQAVSRILNWFVLEQGTAMLLDTLGGRFLVREQPPVALPPERVIAGPVTLLRLTRGEEPAPRLVETIHAVAQPGSVLLIAASDTDVGAFGSNLALEASQCGAVGILADGPLRDAGLVERLPIFAAAQTITPLGGDERHRYETLDESDAFGERWSGGDWLLHDRDGFLRIPSGDVADVLAALLAVTDEPLSKLVVTP